MKELVLLVGSAKSVIDNGLSRVGRRLSSESAADRALVLLAGRAVATSDALALLALHSHANEALPLLRSLVDFAVHARWVAHEDSEARARAFLEERAGQDWSRAWDGARLSERARALGVPPALAERAQLSFFEHQHANAHGLPWAHVFPEKCGGIAPEELLRAAAAAMAHVILALERRWPGEFEGAERLLQESRAV